jgi:GTP-binding protein TypA/BipA
VVNQTFDLFDRLGATEDQLDFPVVYASALQGWATLDPRQPGTDMRPLFEAILGHVPTPPADVDGSLQMQVCALDYSSYVGRLAIGRIRRGRLAPSQEVAVVNPGRAPVRCKVNQVLGFRGLERVPLTPAEAGDIVLVTGLDDVSIGATIADAEAPEALPPLAVDEPTMSMFFQVNTSPFAGREGKYVTSRNLRDRLQRELLTNVALRVEDTGDADVFLVCGRGELHLTILIENMRRDGYELAVSRPRVLMKEVDGELHGTRAARLPDPGARTDRLPERVPEPHARHRPDEPRVRRLRTASRRHRRWAQRRAGVVRERRRGRVRAVEPAGTRAAVREPGRSALRGDDRRHPQPRERPRRQSVQDQEAH